jgi:hypothetical protein
MFNLPAGSAENSTKDAPNSGHFYLNLEFSDKEKKAEVRQPARRFKLSN